nr:MAG TPA: hypothetical protein [Caudoviricetes sp.]
MKLNKLKYLNRRRARGAACEIASYPPPVLC